MGHAMRVLCQRLERVALAWGAGQAWVVYAGALAGQPVALLARFGRLALAQQYRQGPAQGVAEAVLVVLRCPQAQFEQRRWQRWASIEQFQGGLELVEWDFALAADLH